MPLQLGQALGFVTGAWGHNPVDVLKHQGYLAAMDKEHVLDARGLLCPLPVLKARKRLQAISAGEELIVQADDPAAIVDIPHFCNEAGHTLAEVSEAEDHQVYVIRKG